MASVTLKIYETPRRFGTKGRGRKTSRHSKSVHKAIFALNLNSSEVFQPPKTSEDMGNEPHGAGSDHTKVVLLAENVSPEEAVRYLDSFNQRVNNLSFRKKAREYSERKAKLLYEFAAVEEAELPPRDQDQLRRRLSVASFKYYEYQVVILIQEGDEVQRIRSTKLRSLSQRTNWKTVGTGIESEENETSEDS